MERIKINDLEVGKTYQDIPLVMVSAVSKLTRAGNPYLNVKLYDGKDTIMGNYWDWSTGKIPGKNAILNVSCTVDMWQDNKQLNIKALTSNKDIPLTEFINNGGHDPLETYREAYALLSDVKDDFYRSIALACLEELRERWLQIPAACGFHHNYVGGTLYHCLSVAKIARAIAMNVEKADVDLCVVAGFLHDIGKLFAYKFVGVIPDMTNEGLAYEHLFIGAEFIGNFAESHFDVEEPGIYYRLMFLRHCILAHHGKMEYGSPVTPAMIEAHIVSHADGIDATTEMVRNALPSEHPMWTEKIYGAGNVKHFNIQFVEDCHKPEPETEE